MVARKSDAQQRKERVLAIVVNEYIKTVTPVSSKAIVEEYLPDISSATVRNILAELEKEGYLFHPHTSAGRIPTQQGYRYYVDHLMNEIQLLEKERSRIQAEYTRQVNELEQLLDKTSEVISDVTHYTSIVSLDGENDKLYYHGMGYVVGYPEFHDFQRIRALLEMLEEKEKILELINRELDKRVKVFIGAELKCKGISDCSLIVSRYHSKRGPSGRLAVIGPTRMDYERVISTLNYLSELMEKMF